MRKMAFLSRHQPTPEQLDLADEAGYELVPVGDVDGFSRVEIARLVHGYQAVCCVHAGAALNIASLANESGLVIGVFANAARPAEGGKPSFAAAALHTWRVYGNQSFGVFAA